MFYFSLNSIMEIDVDKKQKEIDKSKKVSKIMESREIKAKTDPSVKLLGVKKSKPVQRQTRTENFAVPYDNNIIEYVGDNFDTEFMDNMKDFSYDMLKMPMVASKQDRFKERLKNDKIISRAMNNRLFETLNGLEFRMKWVVSYCFHYTKTFVEKE